ncbi:MAG TPA: hypothetical protein VFF40_14420 [Acidimicrobiia bacterium]|nr:hypothetical protein [Acidimicrobiia bacterium]
MRIGLLIVGHVDEASRHVAGDYPELFGALLEPVGITLEPYAVDEGVFPDSEDECEGWICSPSRGSAFDEQPWLGDAEELIRRMVDRERPYVGICFGHQLLAQALGTRVARSEKGWQVGVHSYEITAREPWMDPPAAEIAVIASHQDQVTELPRDARLLARASGGGCAVAGFAVGERAWTLQPHPEFTVPLAEDLLARRVAVIGSARVADARATLDRPLDQATIARWIGNFFSS